MNLSRRGLIGGLLCAPAIIRPGVLMPVVMYDCQEYNLTLTYDYGEFQRLLSAAFQVPARLMFPDSSSLLLDT